MKPGNGVLKNKWRWPWTEEVSRDGEPFGSWCQRAWCLFLHVLKLLYTSSGKKVLARHELDPSLKNTFVHIYCGT